MFFVPKKLKTRLVLGVVFTTLPLLAFSVIGYFYVESMNRLMEDAVQDLMVPLDPIHDLQAGLSDFNMAFHDYLIDPTSPELDKLLASRNAVEGLLENARHQRPFVSGDGHQTLLLVERHFAFMTTLVDRLAQSGPSKQTAHEISTNMKEVDLEMQELALIFDQIVRGAKKESETIWLRVSQERKRLFVDVGIVLFLGVTIGVFSAVYLGRSLFRPIRELLEGTRRLGAKDLDYRIPVTSADELGELAMAFNSMAERLDRTYKVLNDMASRDDLTLLLNAREFHKRLETELIRAKRYQHSLALIFMDVDHFKSVNDVYGHQVGDHVLRAVARLLSQRVRPSDHVARYGGEEFAVICPETALYDARILAERIRLAFDGSTLFRSESASVTLTVSLGVSGFPDTSSDPQELLRQADLALYRAKRDGRNGARVFERGLLRGSSLSGVSQLSREDDPTDPTNSDQS